MLKRLNIFKMIGWLFAPIGKNGAFFVFMFALGYLCTQLEIMPYYLRNRGAKPYELSVPELFLDDTTQDPNLCKSAAIPIII